MRLITIFIGTILGAGCSSTPTDNTVALDRACSVQDCFLERDVRDFEVIDQTTLIVYIGSQRCAFQVQLSGTFCDMTFAPELYFHSRTQDRLERSLAERGPGGTLVRGQARTSDLRICANDLQVEVSGGVFTDSQLSTNRPADPFADPLNTVGNLRSQCQVTGVESITDDELVELYVARGIVAPPPPMGSGEVKVEEQEDERGEQEAAGSEPSAATQSGAEAAPFASQPGSAANLRLTAGRD
jgi:hypothetical protein